MHETLFLWNREASEEAVDSVHQFPREVSSAGLDKLPVVDDDDVQGVDQGD